MSECYCSNDVGWMMSSIFRIILVTCVARNSCCRLPARVSKTPCSRMSFVPTSLQSMPRYGLLSLSCEREPCVGLLAGCHVAGGVGQYGYDRLNRWCNVGSKVGWWATTMGWHSAQPAHLTGLDFC